MPFSHFRLLSRVENRAALCIPIHPNNSKYKHLKSFKIKCDKMTPYCYCSQYVFKPQQMWHLHKVSPLRGTLEFVVEIHH